MEIITRDKFIAYERVRRSGVTNMFAVSTVQRLSKLTKDEIFDIMENYGQYNKQYHEGEK